MKNYLISSLFFFGVFLKCCTGFLYPIESESRQVKSLNGNWLFNYGKIGWVQKWYEIGLKKSLDYSYMPVPGSFNEIDLEEGLLGRLRDYLGWVWYERNFYMGKQWSGSRIFVYFGAVDHYAVIWCNGQQVVRHRGGHVPFNVEITQQVNWVGSNSLVVAVNNTLTPYTIPQGYYRSPNDTSRYPPQTYLYSHDFDYFDYAGINRNVFLYSVPQTFIKEIDVTTEKILKNGSAIFQLRVTTDKDQVADKCKLELTDENGKCEEFIGCNGDFLLQSVRPWYPGSGMQYALVVNSESEGFTDVYRMDIGFRSLSWDSEGIHVNGVKSYFQGFGMHEDSPIRGRGYDDVTMLRDSSLLWWTGANAIRTSHYPYSEEFLMRADMMGTMVILEVPACSLEGFGEKLYKEHERVTLEIVSKYKHHPSVVMWSLANEPASNLNISSEYFSKLYQAVKRVDQTRPVTFVTSRHFNEDKAVKWMDVICLNRYSGWYQDGGRLDLVEYQIEKEIRAWAEYKKPIIITEYGAGAIPGQHDIPPSMWSENYQTQLLEAHFKVFDKLKQSKLLAGEMIWNLIDFRTPQEYNRPGFCMKGIFTRNREPKAAAQVVRNRYGGSNNRQPQICKSMPQVNLQKTE